MKVPDIYFEEYWGLLNAEQDGGTYESYCYEDENGIILHRFIKRETMLSGIYDIISPSGFNGPVVLKYRPERKSDLLRSFNHDFQQYCMSNNIVAEYVRFSPWIKNHEDFKDIYKLKHHAQTIGIDLTKDYFNDEFRRKRRANILKAEKSGMEIEFDFNAETVDEFYRLYCIMYDKNNQDDPASIHRLSREYISDLVEKCKGHLFIMNAILHDAVISSAIYIYSDQYVHGYLAGNDPIYLKNNAHSLIISKACEWGKDNHKSALHLGGSRNEGLYNFKKQFTKEGVYDFYVGYRVRLNDPYDQLIQLRGKANEAYFPAYRE